MKEKVLLETPGARVELLDGGAACLRFQSDNGRVNSATAGWAAAALRELQDRVKAFVVESCAGYDNEELCILARSKNWKALEEASADFQNLTGAMRTLSVPVVAALQGSVTDLGLEIAMAAGGVCAAEAVLGFDAKGTPFPPTAGGLAELALSTYAIGQYVPGCDIVPFLKRIFQLVVLGKPCQGTEEAIQKGVPLANVTRCSREALMEKARAKALSLAEQGYCPPAGERSVAVSGTTGAAAMEITAVNLHGGGFIAHNRYLLAADVAWVLGGGDVPKGTSLTETQLRKLEREAFLISCRRIGEKEETA